VKFVDEAEITVIGGKGGDGCISFRREKYVPRGGPDGGDGGNGGNVYIIADPNLSTLADLEHIRIYRAGDGENGKGKNKHGKRGKDVYIKVPLGTDVYDKGKKEFLGSILTPFDTLLIAKGGKGGKGNARFATPTRQAPRIREKGKEGEKKELKLILRLLADVGLVGFPNAGKSRLLQALTGAGPKIADYPFTTLTPNLGMLRSDRLSFTIADIPGIIEDAHLGKGLGLDFLKHIERSKILVFVIDVTDEPLKKYRILIKEIEKYNPLILSKPKVVVFNKIDLLKSVPKISLKEPFLFVSALKKINIEKLKSKLEDMVGPRKDS